jgi:hypothetical protein
LISSDALETSSLEGMEPQLSMASTNESKSFLVVL